MTQEEHRFGKRSLGFLRVYVLAAEKGERILTVLCTN